MDYKWFKVKIGNLQKECDKVIKNCITQNVDIIKEYKEKSQRVRWGRGRIVNDNLLIPIDM